MASCRGFLVRALAALALFSVANQETQAASAHLTLQSEFGDFIGHGQNWDITYTPQNSFYFFALIQQTLPGGQPTYLTFIMGTVTSDSTNTYTTLDFSTAQLGIPLQPGTYDDAQRAAFADPGHPGLDVDFQNRGSNSITGSFTIHEVSFYTDQNNTLQVESFSASFTEHSEGGEPALRGTFTYDAQIVPEPSSLVMLSLGATALAAGYGKMRMRRSTPRSSGLA